MKKGKPNARATNSDSSKRGNSKLGNFIRTNKSSRKRNDTVDVESTDNAITNDIDRINDIVANDTFDADNGIIAEASESRSGSGNDSGRGSDGRGRSGSDRDRSDNTDNRKRGRRSRAEVVADLARELDVSIEEAQKVYESQRAPRKVKTSEITSDGITGSVLLLSTLFEGGADLLAMASGKDYLQLQKAEAKELSEAVVDLIESFPATVRKRFDKLMRYYIPYWKVAKTLTVIAYPRWQIYQIEKELQANAKTRPANQNKNQSVNEAKTGVDDTEQPTTSNSQSGFDSHTW